MAAPKRACAQNYWSHRGITLDPKIISIGDKRLLVSILSKRTLRIILPTPLAEFASFRAEPQQSLFTSVFRHLSSTSFTSSFADSTYGRETPVGGTGLDMLCRSTLSCTQSEGGQ